jgi:hypothetical protein
VLAGIRLPTERVPALCLVAGPGSLVGPISHLAGIPVSGGLPDDLFLSIPARRLAVCLRCLGRRRRDRPEAACLPGSRAAVGLAGGFSAVQKLLTTTTAATAFRGAGDGNRTRTVSLGTDSLQGHSPRWLRARVMARVPFRTRMSVDAFERYSRIRLCCNAFRVWSG